MKGSRSTTNKQNKQGLSHKPRPEIRDDMDSHKKKVDDNKNDTLSRKARKRIK
jgi:hypothetical protein